MKKYLILTIAVIVVLVGYIAYLKANNQPITLGSLLSPQTSAILSPQNSFNCIKLNDRGATTSTVYGYTTSSVWTVSTTKPTGC